VALKGISGTLVSADLLEDAARGSSSIGRLRAAIAAARQTLGPASSARHICDGLVLPLFAALDLDVRVVSDGAASMRLSIRAAGREVASGAVGGWNADLHRLREAAMRAAPASRARWWIGANGPSLRIVDGARAYSRRCIDIDVEMAAADDAALGALQAIFTAGQPASLASLDALVRDTERHRASVGTSLQAGVEDALPRLVAGFARGRNKARTLDAALGDALTMVYRILFLLFAEARGLVPQWHPVYRDSYTIESLRPLAEGGGAPTGLWQSLQAIARLAHRGCTAGSLRLVPFNGRLFAPAAAPLADTIALDDRLVRDVLLAVTTRPGRDRRERISYADLGVEQLGAVYERVLDYAPLLKDRAVTLTRSGRRKTTGTFYTPRSMTEYLVRRTLAPLVRGRTPERILALRVVDPAMGSGAFLVAACRYLADAYEAALLAEGALTASDITPADRAAFRRVVAQRCLYGVDLNPTAVQLARLSLWLCTLAADRPLSFFDHHLRAGNSLVGARLQDVARQPPVGSRGRAAAPLPLFEDELLAPRLASAIASRLEVERQPDDSAAIVRSKERTIDALHAADGPLSAWRVIADAWCSAWFWREGIDRLSARSWTAFASVLRGGPDELPRGTAARWRRAADEAAARERFFHWEIEFPEIFFDEAGAARGDGGFDAVVGNPPWAAAHALTAFSRESGCYTLHGAGHANLYQLFAERMLRLAAPRGRVGMLMPSGLLGDHGCAALRTFLFERCEVDAAIGFDNRDALFPIHRGMRFSLLTATRGGATPILPTLSAIRSAGVLDDVPDEGGIAGAVQIPLSLLRRFSGEGLAVPELPAERDRAILARVLAVAPPLGSADGWHARFGRELNATEDRPHFGAAGMPVLEGKLIDPFVAHVDAATQFVEPAVARRLLGRRAHVDRARLGYREVAASTNRQTLIACVVPPGVVTTHTIFCMRSPADEELHWFLCGIFNSFAANYLIRMRGGTHVPASVIHQLPVPVLPRRSSPFQAIVALARESSRTASTGPRSELQAQVTRAYGLDEDDFAYVLGTFPIVLAEERRAALAAFRALGDAI
jgi:N-6 DNA Methylase/Eco57I restriction-modification methylase